MEIIMRGCLPGADEEGYGQGGRFWLSQPGDFDSSELQSSTHTGTPVWARLGYIARYARVLGTLENDMQLRVDA